MSRATEIHVILNQWDTEALCGFPRAQMEWKPTTLWEVTPTCAECAKQKRLLRGEVKYPVSIAGCQA